MKLNHDCVRQVLLDLEKNLDLPNIEKSYEEAISPSTFEKYGEKTVEYSLLQLINVHYVDGVPLYGSNVLLSCSVSSITWDGHQFLDTIRDSKIWKKTKGILSHLESASITFASNVASSVLSDFIFGQTRH